MIRRYRVVWTLAVCCRAVRYLRGFEASVDKFSCGTKKGPASPLPMSNDGAGSSGEGREKGKGKGKRKRAVSAPGGTTTEPRVDIAEFVAPSRMFCGWRYKVFPSVSLSLSLSLFKLGFYLLQYEPYERTGPPSRRAPGSDDFSAWRRSCGLCPDFVGQRKEGNPQSISIGPRVFFRRVHGGILPYLWSNLLHEERRLMKAETAFETVVSRDFSRASFGYIYRIRHSLRGPA